jgi:hypothetical protein
MYDFLRHLVLVNFRNSIEHMIIATIVLLVFVWFVASIWWLYRSLGEKGNTNSKWWDWALAAPVLGVLWVVEQARKAKKHGVK